VLGSVPTAPRALADYEPIVGEDAVQEIRELARPLAGARVLHINATTYGGGVAEILGSLVPLTTDAGLVADWQVMKGSSDFFQVTKAMHNSLQGMLIDWTPEMRETWLQTNEMNARLFDDEYDFVVIHDPQPAPLLGRLAELRDERPKGRWVWRCHIDLTEAQAQIWDVLRSEVEGYDAAIFSLDDYVKEDLALSHVFTVPPAIDPLSPKNGELPTDMVEAVIQRYNIDSRCPLIAQVSRFDPWKDPLGVIDVYRIVKQEIPNLHLVFVASLAEDDPEGLAWFERTVRRAGEDYNIHILSNLNGVGNTEVNALQRAADVVIQKSVREGFGLVVAEALWKGRPVVAGKVGGIPLQVIDGVTGHLVSTTEECARQVAHLLKNPSLAHEMGRAGQEHVRRNFLITRYLRDYLHVFRTLAGIESDTTNRVGARTRSSAPAEGDAQQ
jgi:trehalose synthase